MPRRIERGCKSGHSAERVTVNRKKVEHCASNRSGDTLDDLHRPTIVFNPSLLASTSSDTKHPTS
jgi:hypothetical protein